MFQDPDTHLLYIVARASDTLFPLCACTSPLAVLDRFIGDPSELDAPEWSMSDSFEMHFRQPRASFAKLFAQLAVSDYNSDQVS